jgi:SAM-dependent methyltransferase
MTGVEDSAEFEFESLARAHVYRRAIARHFSTALCGRVLEVGAGIGQMTEVLASLPAVTEITALEPNADFIGRLAERVPRARTICGTSNAIPTGETFDSAVMVNVLEHIEDDVGELIALRRHIVPGRGTMCILVPARPELYSPIDRIFGHHRRYTRRSLRAALERAGYVVSAAHYFNLVGYFCWLLNFRLRGCTRFEPGLVELFDRYVFRLCDAIESRLGRPPIGQSVVAFAQRPHD